MNLQTKKFFAREGLVVLSIIMAVGIFNVLGSYLGHHVANIGNKNLGGSEKKALESFVASCELKRGVALYDWLQEGERRGILPKERHDLLTEARSFRDYRYDYRLLTNETKKKYPEYNDVGDRELAEKIVKKYSLTNIDFSDKSSGLVFVVNKISLFCLVFIYPFYWIGKFVIWAIRILKMKG